MDHISEGNVLRYHALDAFLQQQHLIDRPPVRTLVGPGCEPQRGSGSKGWSGCPLGAAGFCDIEPFSLPYPDGVHKDSLWPIDFGELAHHGTTTLRVLPVDHLRLHIKNLEPKAEMWRDAEEGLTHDDERRDVKERIWGQIVKIQPVLEHETPHERVKGEYESTEEVGDEHHPLIGHRSRDDLRQIRKPMLKFRG